MPAAGRSAPQADWEPDVDDIGADDIGGDIGVDSDGSLLEEPLEEPLDTISLIAPAAASIQTAPGFAGHFDDLVYDDLERRIEWTFKAASQRPLSAASTETVSQEDDVIVHDLESLAGSGPLQPDE